MKLTAERHQKVLDVIHEHRLIKDRVRALRKLRFKVQQCPLRMGSVTCVGWVHSYVRSTRMQIGSPKGYMKYAYVVMFNPLDFEKIWDLNRKTFGRLI